MAVLKAPLSPKDHIRGSTTSPVTIIEYGDYECPYCAAAHPILRRLQERFKNNLQFAFRHFPLNEVHPFAEMAAETAEFASAHGKFWEMHDFIYQNQDQLSGEFLLKVIKVLGLPEKEFSAALRMDTYTEIVKNDFLGGVKSGVNGTPSLFINDFRYNGPLELDALEGYINDLTHSTH